MVDRSEPGADAPQVIENYRLGGLLGSGGMGTVHEATDTRNGARVAIKLLHAHLAADESFRDRFNREAHVASLLRSPYTVPLLDSGFDEGRYFLVTRFVEGQTLREALRPGPLEPARALRLAAQVAHSLEEAELRGIVHRDIKPENIMLAEPDGTAQVLDFGIARQTGSVTLTGAGSFLGTPLYAAPEVFGGSTDHRADIYSLGVTLYHMLTGRPPFEGEPLELLRQHREEPPPEEPLAALPSAVVEMVLRCMAKSPADRPQSASELAGLLERLSEQSAARGDEAVEIAGTEVLERDERRPGDTSTVSITLDSPSVGGRFLRAGRGSSYELVLRNDGDETVEFRLEATNGEETVAFSMPDRVAVQPHDAETVSIDVKPRRRRWWGESESHPFHISASDGTGGPPIVVSGEFEERPERWVPVAEAAFFSVAAIAVVFAALSFLGGREGTAPADTVDTLSLEQYFARLDTAETEFVLKINGAIRKFQGAATAALSDRQQQDAIDAAREFLGVSKRLLGDFRAALQGIDAPPAVEGAHQDFVADLEELVRAVEALGARGITSFADIQALLDDLEAGPRREFRGCRVLVDIAAENGTDVRVDCAVPLGGALAGVAGGGPAGGGEQRAGSERQSVSVTLGAVNETDGLDHIWGGDGLTEPSERAGRSCRELRANGSDLRYAFFKIDDGFIQATTTPFGYFVTVEYFDEGDFQWWVEYDGPSSVFAISTLAGLEGTGTWRTHTFHLADATFGRADYVLTEYGIVVDFRVAATEADPALCVRRVVVTRSGPLIRVRFTTTSDLFEARPADAAQLGTVTVIEPAELPEGWIATRKHVQINQSIENASAGRAIELVVDMRLTAEALEKGLGLDVQKGVLGAARIQFFAVTGDSAQLVKTVTIQGAERAAADLTASELQDAFPEFPGQPAAAAPSATVAPASAPAPTPTPTATPTPAPTPATATPPAAFSDSCQGAALRVESWDYPKQLSGRSAPLTVDISYLLPVGMAVESLAVIVIVDAEPVLFSDVLAAFPDATLPTGRDPSTATLTPFVFLLADGDGGMIADGAVHMLTFSDTLPRGQSWNDDSRYALRWSELIDPPFRLGEPPLVRIIFESEGQRWFYNTQGTCRAAVAAP